MDAVVVATPFERVRYGAYLQAFQQLPVTPAAVRDAARPYSVDLIIFAHSATETDERFLARFRSPNLTFTGFGTLRPVRVSHFGPALDFYSVPNQKRVLRWIGYVRYEFDLIPVAKKKIDVANATGEFSIVDPYGQNYEWKFALGNYR